MNAPPLAAEIGTPGRVDIPPQRQRGRREESPRWRFGLVFGGSTPNGREVPPTTAEQDRLLSLRRARRLRRRGRAVLVWAVALYLAVQLAVGLVAARWGPVQVVNEDWKRPRPRQLVTGQPERPLVLMLGSSRTNRAFRAGALNGTAGPDGRPLLAYNFGVAGAGPIHEYLYLRDLLAEGVRPRLLLIEYVPLLLVEPARGVTSEERLLGTGWLSARQLWHLWPYLVHPERQGREWLQAQLAPCYALRGGIRSELEDLLTGQIHLTAPPVDEWGWRILPATPSTDGERAAYLDGAYQMYSGTLSRFRPGAGPVRAMRDLMELCRRERIAVALVLMPESSVFRGLYSAEAQEMPAALLAELQAAYGVPVIDAGRWLDDDDFEDGHHVLLAGADKFTARLAVEIQRLLAAPNGTGPLPSLAVGEAEQP